jgi:hypothetical protein
MVTLNASLSLVSTWYSGSLRGKIVIFKDVQDIDCQEVFYWDNKLNKFVEHFHSCISPAYTKAVYKIVWVFRLSELRK